MYIGQPFPNQPTTKLPRAFISYAHDSPQHQEKVIALAELLQRSGVAVVLDEWAKDRRVQWPAWARQWMNASDFILVIASPAYRRVGRGEVRDDRSRGIQAEHAHIEELLYRQPQAWFHRILPVLLPGCRAEDIPEVLRPFSGTQYHVRALTLPGIEELLRAITGQPMRRPPPIGAMRHLPPRPPVVEAHWRAQGRVLAILVLVAAGLAALIAVLWPDGDGGTPSDSPSASMQVRLERSTGVDLDAEETEGHPFTGAVDDDLSLELTGLMTANGRPLYPDRGSAEGARARCAESLAADEGGVTAELLASPGPQYCVETSAGRTAWLQVKYSSLHSYDSAVLVLAVHVWAG